MALQRRIGIGKLRRNDQCPRNDQQWEQKANLQKACHLFVLRLGEES